MLHLRNHFLESSLALWHTLDGIRVRLKEIGGPYLPVAFNHAFRKAKRKVDRLICHVDAGWPGASVVETAPAAAAYAKAEAGVVEVACLAGDIVRGWATMPSLN